MPVSIKHGTKRTKRKKIREAVLSIDGLSVSNLTNAQIKLLLLAVAYQSGLINDQLRVDVSRLDLDDG